MTLTYGIVKKDLCQKNNQHCYLPSTLMMAFQGNVKIFIFSTVNKCIQIRVRDGLINDLIKKKYLFLIQQYCGQIKKGKNEFLTVLIIYLLQFFSVSIGIFVKWVYAD